MRKDSTADTWERLAALLRPMHRDAMATARRLCRSAADGDDLYQESVVRAFEKLHTLRDESRFRSWFFATMLSRHRDRYRRAFWKRLVPIEQAFTGGREPVGEDGAQWPERTRRADRAAEALAMLDAAQREVIVLFEIDGYTIEEIADMQRVSISAVKSRLARGREKLRGVYERRGWAAPAGRDAGESPRVASPRDDLAPRRRAVQRLATATVAEPGKERSRD